MKNRQGILVECMNRHVDWANNYSGYDACELESGEIEDLVMMGCDRVWYWYGTGSYEGTGYCLLHSSDGKWALETMSHCSCYGPTEFTPTWVESLDGFKMSGDYEKETACLLTAARSAKCL